MSKEFEVSFNSPQCGWMAVGFKGAGAEFNTTTAHTPHDHALSDLLKTIREILSADAAYKKTLKWNRNPEEYDFNFGFDGKNALLEIVEYPTKARERGETVFSFAGDAYGMAAAFETTFQQMYEERNIDEFEENWHQTFPIEEFSALKHAIKNYGA